MENENTKSQKNECHKNEADSEIILHRIAHLKEFLSEATSMWENLEMSEDPGVKEEMNRLKEAVKKIVEEENEHRSLLQQMENDDYAANGLSPSSSLSKVSTTKGNIGIRDFNGSNSYCTEEERMNKCNHLIEKVKQSEERFMALKQQERLIYHMQKKAENKLAAFQALLDKNKTTTGTSSVESQSASLERALNISSEDEVLPNGNEFWGAEVFEEPQKPWSSENSLKSNASDQMEFQPSGYNYDSPDVRQLHVSLEHIKNRVKSIQQISDNKNMTEALSSEDDLPAEQDRVAAVEWERKRLKNKLVELQEKKKMNDELLKELSFLKDAANMVGAYKNSKDDDANFMPSSTKDHLKDKRKRKLDELQTTLDHLKGLMNALTSEENTWPSTKDSRENASNLVHMSSENSISSNRQNQTLPSAKRDNVKKEQNSNFPARRHYEAEGRANEDADLPGAQITASPSPSDWQDNPQIQEKIRKLQVARDRLKIIQDLMASIQEAKQSGKQIPIEHLQLLSSLEEDENEISVNEEPGHDNVDRNDNPTSNNENPMAEGIMHAASKDNGDADSKTTHENNRLNDDGLTNLETKGLDALIKERDHLTKIHDEFLRLQQMLPKYSKKNEDRIRSSGEGGDTLKQRNHNDINAVENHAPSGNRQANLLLTRQNLASIESQIHHINSNMQSRDLSKKDVINNLSKKMAKASIQNSVNESMSETTRDNLDNLSTYSNDINQIMSQDEMQRKSVLDLLNHDKNKYKGYYRNQETKIASNSSIDSEPLEGSTSALAQDTTAAATWGGSSTQENFDDDNDEVAESLEDQEREERTNNHWHQQRKPISISTRNIATSTRNKVMEQNCQSVCSEPKILHINKNSSESASGGSNEITHAPPGIMDAATDYHLRMSSKFIQQLKDEVDQLNTLYQQRFAHERQLNSFNPQQVHNCFHPFPNNYNPVQNVPDILHHNNQQLLYSLSHCYYALYMQQLEIQQLQRCLRQNINSEGLQPPPPTSSETSAEDTTPQWFLNSTLPGFQIPPNHLSPTSPASSLNLVPPSLTLGFPSLAPLPMTDPNSLRASYTSNSAPPSYGLPNNITPLGQSVGANTFGPSIGMASFGSAPPTVPYALGSGVSPLVPPISNMPTYVPPNDMQNFITSNGLTSFVQTPTASNLVTSSSLASFEPTPCNSTYGSVTSLAPTCSPARAIVHPAGQATRTSETLNNQVPPRTRANNFWDNFRSYSRQNLLSTTNNNVKRNENIGLSVAPQIRQVHPLIAKDTPFSEHSKESVYCENDSGISQFPCRGAPGLGFQENSGHSKKPNLFQNTLTNQNSADNDRKINFSNVSPAPDQTSRVTKSHGQNVQPIGVLPVSYPSTINMNPKPQTVDTKVKSQSLVCSTSLPSNSNIDIMANPDESRSTFIKGLYQEAQNLKSEDKRQQALSIIRTLVLNERVSDAEITSQNSNKSDQRSSIKSESSDILEQSSETITSEIAPLTTTSNEFYSSRSSTDLNSQWSGQHLPTATIMPLGKHVSKPASTGAIKKKLMNRAMHSCPLTFTNGLPWDNSGLVNSSIAPSLQTTTNSNPINGETYEIIIEKTLADILPFIRSQVVDCSSPIFRANICSRIIEVLKNYVTAPLPNRHLSQLRHALENLLAKFSGLKWCDCEADFLKSVSDLLFKELSHLKSSGHFSFLEESGEMLNNAPVGDMPPQPDVLPPQRKPLSDKRRIASLPCKNSREDSNASDAANYFLQQESEDHTSELTIKMPEEENSFPIHFNSILSQDFSQNPLGIETNYNNHPNIQPVRAVTAEEDMGYECDPEAEAEPEVEAGTEADLAEADQSPGQQGASAIAYTLPLVDSWPVDPSVVLPGRNMAAASVTLANEEEICGIAQDNMVETASGAQGYTNSNCEQEIKLDDIPTKLAPLSEEELQRQIKNEQSSNTLLLDVLDDINLSEDNESIREPSNSK